MHVLCHFQHAASKSVVSDLLQNQQLDVVDFAGTSMYRPAAARVGQASALPKWASVAACTARSTRSPSSARRRWKVSSFE